VLAGFDECAVGLDRPRRFACAVALAEIQFQVLDDLSRIGRQQNQVSGQEHRLFDVVGDQEHRLGAALPDLQQQLLHLFASEGVQRAERLIHQQYTRIGRQRASQAHALPLPAGQLPDAALLETGQIHQRQHFPGLGFALLARYTGQFEAEGDVGEYVLPRQQGVVLKHHAAFGAGALDRNAIQGDAPGAGFDETCDQVQQRSLAAARWTQGDQQLLRAQAQGNVRQYGRGRTGVLRADTRKVQQGHGNDSACWGLGSLCRSDRGGVPLIREWPVHPTLMYRL
jgi:hypothetical protein